jgi:hypothetical protein
MDEDDKVNVVGDEKPSVAEKLSEEPVPVAKRPADVYLRLEGIYEGDVKVTPTQQSHAFMFHFNDLSGNGYLCPVYCEENQRDGVRKMLRRIKPLILTFTDTDTPPVIEEGTKENPVQEEDNESVALHTAPSKVVH